MLSGVFELGGRRYINARKFYDGRRLGAGRSVNFSWACVINALGECGVSMSAFRKTVSFLLSDMLQRSRRGCCMTKRYLLRITRHEMLFADY